MIIATVSTRKNNLCFINIYYMILVKQLVMFH
jgi:hypothetical protein